VTLKEYTKSLPKERVQLAATDLDEAAKIEQEHAAVPGAVFDTPEQAEGNADAQQPAAPAQSFDLTNDDDVKGFIKGMELSHPELVNRLRRDERAWDDMLALDSNYTSRIQRDGQIKFTGDDKADYDFFRWAYGRGMLQSDTSIGGLASAFGRGLWQMAKGAAKLGATAAKSAANPAAAMELGATTVDAAQAAVAEYQQLGAGLAALTSGDNPQVKVAAMYELAKFADTEQKNHNAWRKAINDSFAEVPVDEDSVEFLSEAFDISNLIGAGAGKVVTTGLKRAGAAGAAELLGKSRKALGSEMLAAGVSKVPVIGTPYKRAILVGQADLLSEEAQIAYKAVAEAQADLAAKRATLAAAPAADPKDVLLKQVAEADANVARQQAAFDVANTKLTTVRQGVTEALDLEGRGLMDRAASGAVEGAGVAVRGTGRAMTRAYRGLSELLTGEADNAAFDMAAGQVAGNLANKGNIVTRIGQDMVAAGRTMAQNGATIPYFRRLRQAEDATKLTRGAAAFIDWSHLGWAADKVGDTLKAGAAGVPVSGAFGYVASGGDLAAAAESAGAGAAYGIGGGAYGQWEAYKDPRFRYEELLANRRQFRDTLSARDVGGASQLQIFDQLDAGDQLAVSTYAQGKPDVAFRFINDRNQASGYYDRDNNVVVINKASKTPVADIFRHEVAHFVERHGLQAQVREMYLGDAEKGVIGQYTALDPLGNPVFVESTDPDGATRYGYKLNEAGEKLKADYESKIRVVDPTFKMSDDYLASELFAEQYADRMLGGGFRRDLSRNAVDNIVDALAAKPVLKNFLGGIGLLFDQNDNVVGTGVFKELKANEGVRRLISGFTSEVSKGKKAAIEDSAEQHVFTETELRNPELATKWLQGGGAMRFGPDGKPVYDSKGVPQFLTEKEADAQQRDLANELITEIEKHVAGNPEDADLMQRREIVDVNGVKRTLFSGRRIPAAVIDALEKQNRFNPHQLAHLRAASASVEKNGTGAMIAHFYQAASRKLGGKAYKTVGGRWRRDGVVGFQITKDGNVVINSVSWEQLAENATKAAKTKLAREVYATAGMPVDTAITADVKTYLGNLIDGKPGATDLGESRRDFVNNLLGIRMAANAEANPLFETTTAPKTILTNLRLDRMNRMAPLDYVEYAWGPKQYRQAKANMRPDVLPIPERFTGTGEEGDRQSKKVDAPGFFKRFDIQEYTKGGKYFDVASGEDVTGRVYSSGSIDVSSGKPSLRASDTQVEASTSGRKIRTNLFKQSAGWKWVGEAPAKTSTLVSVEMGKDHLYTLTSQFDTPVEMARYEDKKSEPRLRPTTRGVLRVGEKVGEIEVRGRIHPVYDKITTATDAPGRGIINRGEDSLQFRPEANDETTRIAAEYVKKAFGRKYEPHAVYDEAPEARLKEIADYFQNVAKHQPDAPDVLRSYRAMADETIEQYKAMIAAGIKPEPYKGKGEPYASSEEMMRDVRENKHLYFLRTDNAFGQGTQDIANPLLEKSGLKIGDFELLVNDVFRVVHDYFGHTQQGLQFGPRGEFNAWKSHSRMYSEEAQGAVAAETLAQNAWVNFGAHLRRADGSIPKKGEEGYVPPQERPFGDQKNFVVPAELMQFRPESRQTETPEFKRWSGGKRVYQPNEVNMETPPRSGVFVVFHGTKEDVTTFKPKYPDGLIFTTTDPEFASAWARTRNAEGKQPRNYPVEAAEADRLLAESKKPKPDATDEEWQKYFDSPEYRVSRDAKSQSDANVMKLYANVEKAFDPRRDYKLVEPILNTLPGYENIVPRGLHKQGNWVVYENKAVVDFLKGKGYDAMWLKESSIEGAQHETLAVFEPTQLKSATGNRGTFDPENPDIRYRPEDHPGQLSSENVPTKKATEEYIKLHALTDAEAEAYRSAVDSARTAGKEAIPIDPQYDGNGRPLFEEDEDSGEMKLKVSPQTYELTKAPLIQQIRDRYEAKNEAKISAARKELRAANKVVAELEKAGESPELDNARRAAAAAEEKYNKTAFGWRDEASTKAATMLLEESRRALLEPSVQAGIGWYSKMRSWLQNRFGAGIELFSQLLGATSARTPVDENFKQALDAMKRFSRGDYDEILQRFDDHISPIKERLAKGEIDEDTARKQINEFVEFPTRSNGKKFNANSSKVLQALYGNWLEQTVGPKTPNFAGNLSGRTLKATIDVWAARTLRRLLYENQTYNPETGRISTQANRWRILPEAETGVKFNVKIGLEPGGDFGLGQEIFEKTAAQLNMEPDDLQALLWFHEKHIWDERGWTKASGKKKSSFEGEAGKLDTERVQLGVTTFTNPAEFDREKYTSELRAMRDVIAASPDTIYARVSPSNGLYGGAEEPSFDAEFVVRRGADLSPVLRQTIDTGKKHNQYDVFASKIVDKEHPNSRPGLEIGFKAAEDDGFVNTLSAALRASGVDGFTVARDRRGRPIGIRTQFIPEISARWADDKSILTLDGAAKAAELWADAARKATSSLPPEIKNRLSYEQETFFDTRVFGREEYDTASNAWGASSLDQELGRRAQALGYARDGVRVGGEQPQQPPGI
jgi:hypothetical protein